MHKDNLVLLRNILFKTFIVGLIFAILLFVLTTTFWDLWSSIISSRFHVNDSELGKLIVSFFIHLRFFLIFIILVPAIALHWVIKTKD